MLSAAINVSSQGNNTIVSGVSGKRIRVLGYVLSYFGTVTAQWQDSGSNNLSGPLNGVDGEFNAVPVVPPVMGSQIGWFTTASQGQNLVLNLSGAIQVTGHVVYMLVP